MVRIQLKKEDCYCDLDTFYGNVALKAGIHTEESTIFDCRKICVSQAVASEISDYYKQERQLSDYQVASIILCYGPKANIESQDNNLCIVEIQKGFTV